VSLRVYARLKYNFEFLIFNYEWKKLILIENSTLKINNSLCIPPVKIFAFLA